MSNWITKKEKKEEKPTWIKKKEMSEKETVSDAQKRGKRDIGQFARTTLREGGCAQIKGFGKARRPKKKYS